LGAFQIPPAGRLQNCCNNLQWLSVKIILIATEAQNHCFCIFFCASVLSLASISLAAQQHLFYSTLLVSVKGGERIYHLVDYQVDSNGIYIIVAGK
jgi:hypothetical protein